MKKLLFLLTLLISFSFFGQENKKLELRYHLLDSSLNEVILKDPDVISNKERREIYNYVEYYVSDDAIYGPIKYYYVAEKEPYYSGGLYSYINKLTGSPNTGYVQFKSPENRFGNLRSSGDVLNKIPPKTWRSNDFEQEGEWKKFHPNGNLYLVTYRHNGKLSEEFKQYYPDGELHIERVTEGDKFIRNIYYRNGNLKKQTYFNKERKVIGITKNWDSFGEFSGFSGINEKSAREYLDSKENIDKYEGIYRYSNDETTSQYKFLIVKDDFSYTGNIMEANCVGCQWWKIGSVKFIMNEGAVDDLFDVTWKFPERQNRRDSKFIFTGEFNGGIIKGGSISLIKLYPKLNSKNKNKRVKTGEWAGNGSGIIISKSGYIVTNHHVIEDADDIEVEFILNEEVQKFNAEIVQVDKVNDLAIIKIFDMNFDGIDELPYNFKTRTSDVGTKVYAFGYPMALTAMGKEIKITDGIISSKSGFDGDITTYQITAPIQGGNSGGPLFDDKGNFLGINSSGIRKDVADNVGYTIKSSYILNLIDVMPKNIDLPSNTKLQSLPLTEQIKEITKYVVLIKVK